MRALSLAVTLVAFYLAVTAVGLLALAGLVILLITGTTLVLAELGYTPADFR